MRRLDQTRATLIAEAGVNHDGDLPKALKLVDVAAEAGADFVKFQMFRADAIAAKSAPKAEYQSRAIGDGGQQEMLRALELSPDAFAAIIAHCEAAGV
ncbi:MAG: N-acetylneuraminate synthase family protein, partial [Pseudomonadota bacterium]